MTLAHVMLMVAVVGGAPLSSVGSPITLRFHGNAELSPFGGTPARSKER